jgi:hypothetical protein
VLIQEKQLKQINRKNRNLDICGGSLLNKYKQLAQKFIQQSDYTNPFFGASIKLTKIRNQTLEIE